LAGIISGALALILVPILLGPLGMVLGTVGLLKGARRMGAIAIGVSVLSLILGLILNAILLYVVNGR
jgi:hypothetical protein